MADLRQRTWGIFIKPYIEYGGDKLVQRKGVTVQSPCHYGGGCPSYSTVQGGEPYMLFDKATSFIEIKEKVKKCMDDLGYSKHDILITEIIPFDHIITPLA
ncbi:hypothetical protein [Anaerophilus nitritogenes]|uniref:hypothetical protein n=1 Tax=Anaerophilus nitritogenes TaxID=2498136 RepID=UPI00101D94DB|nr:hypothetical protein [Anaerophilus nitritogenes]